MNNRVKEAFGGLHADAELKQHTKDFICKKTNGYKNRRMFPAYPAAVVIACILLAVFSWNGYSLFFTPVSTISVDINPSLELSINRFDRVISVTSYNEDGNALLSSENIRFMDYRKAVDTLFQNEMMKACLTPEQPVEITVFGNDEKKNLELVESLAARTSSQANVQCSMGNSEDAAHAHALGLSYGKYKAFLELQALDPNVTADDIRDLTMRQIRDRIRACETGEDPSAPEINSNDNHSCPENISQNGNGNGNNHKNENGSSIGNQNGRGNGNGPGNRNGRHNGNGNGRRHGNN